MKTLEIIIEKDGRVTVKAQGFVGPVCLEEFEKLTARLKALGLDLNLISRTPTPEMCQTTTQKTRIQV